MSNLYPKRVLSKPRVILIGARCLDDQIAVSVSVQWFEKEGRQLLARLLSDRKHWDVYDKTTLPRKGDGVDAVEKFNDIALVVALHLCGIGEFPRPIKKSGTVLSQFLHDMQRTDWYNKRNIDLLPICLDKGLPLVVWGDQPWKDKERSKVVQIHHNNLWFYEPKGVAANV